MAGNYTNAYATVDPNKQNIGDAINDVQDQGFRYRAEQRIKDAEEQKKKDDRERKLKEFNDNSPKFVPTGVETEDEYMYAGVQNAANQLFDVQRQLNELNNKTNLTPDEEKKLYQLSAKKNNLQNYPENLKRMMESQTNSAKNYLEGVKNGLYIQDPNIDKKLSSALTGYVPGTDESGLPAAGLYDKDGDGIADVLSFEDVNNQLFIKPTKLMDPFKLAQTFAKDFKLDETSTQKGYITYDNKFVPESELRATIDNLITPESLATEAYKKGLPLNYKWSDEEVNQLKNDLMNHTNSFIGTVSKQKKDLAAEDRDARLAFDKKKQAENLAFDYFQEKGKGQREALKLAAKYGSGAGKSPNLDENAIHGGYVVTSGGKGNIPNDVPKNSPTYSMTGLKNIINNKLTEEVENIYISPDGKKMWFNIATTTKGDDGVEKKVYKQTGSTDQQSVFVKKVQKGVNKKGEPVFYKSVEEFKKDLKVNVRDGSNRTESDELGL